MNGDNRDSDFPPRVDLNTLSAYVDGELPESEHAAVRAHLERDPDARARVAAWRAQKAALRALCGAPEPQSQEETPVIVLRARTSWPRRMAIAACWLVAGAGIGLALGTYGPSMLQGGAEPAAFARRADVAYAVYAPEERHPVEIAASEETHLVAWLSKRLNRPVSVPSLEEYGYSLVGGRLLPGEAGPAAQFLYENQSGTRLALYVTNTAKDEMPVRLLRDGNQRTFYWVNDHMGYAMSGSISQAKLRAIAVDVCGTLGGRPESWQ
ncbi:MAG TPA: anti-sigma factor [Trinickia sp.]|jgi:anti-sigma factor RsiW|nr:anti-sigma factor [Trinickia sp.]